MNLGTDPHHMEYKLKEHLHILPLK